MLRLLSTIVDILLLIFLIVIGVPWYYAVGLVLAIEIIEHLITRSWMETG